jgi:glutathione S-transferase
VQKFLDSTPTLSVTANWHETKKAIVKNGFGVPGAAEKVKLYDLYLHKMEDVLFDYKWLAGQNFTFADIALTPYVNRLDMMALSGMWEKGRLPRVADWFSRIKSRQSFKSSFLDWCPEDLTNDLKNFGSQSWPEVAQILLIEY